MILNFELIRVAVALIGTALAGWQDAKSSFIDDKIVFPMIALGLVLDLATLDQSFILFSVGGALVIGALGYYAYRTGQLGGGDVLLFAGLQLLLPYAPIETAKMLGIVQQTSSFAQVASAIPFILVIFVIASTLALVGSTALYASRLAESGKLKIKGKEPMLVGLAVFSVAFLYWLNTLTPLNPIHAAILAIVLACSVFTVTYKQEMTAALVKQLKINQIEDEDILAIEKMSKKLVEKYKLGKVLTKSEVEKLKKIEKTEGLHYFPVYKDLPRLGPYVLVALLVGIILANPIAYFLFL